MIFEPNSQQKIKKKHMLTIFFKMATSSSASFSTQNSLKGLVQAGWKVCFLSPI